MEASYLQGVIKQFEYYKGLAEKAMAEIPDEALFRQFNGESNSIAMIVQHIAGNMLSRFTDFLTTDGEKPWRNRDAEFENILKTRDEVQTCWQQGWNCLFATLANLTDDELQTIIFIRNDGHTVLEAINRQLAHAPYHVGQIVYVARMYAGADWTSLSIPRNASEQYNRQKFSNGKKRRHFSDDPPTL